MSLELQAGLLLPRGSCRTDGDYKRVPCRVKTRYRVGEEVAGNDLRDSGFGKRSIYLNLLILDVPHRE